MSSMSTQVTERASEDTSLGSMKQRERDFMRSEIARTVFVANTKLFFGR